MLTINHTKKKFLVWFYIFFSCNLYALSFDKLLLRDISSQNTLITEHFHIYWSDEYDYTYPWLVKVDGYPQYIDTLKKESENLYQILLDNNLSLPDRIEIYIANTGIEADGLYTNSISSLGAFTSDDFAEILINAKLEQKTLTNDIRRILAHEMMHVVQYQEDIIKGEDSTPASDKWFTEGTAVATESYIMDNPKYLYEYFEDIINIKGFESTDNFACYGNGFLFYYLIKQYNYSLKDFIDIYKSYPNFSDFINYIENEQNLSKGNIITDIYKSFITNKSFYGDGFTSINIGYSSYRYIQLNLTSSWQLITFQLDTTNFSFLNDIDYLIWSYKDNNWYCISNITDQNQKCIDNYPQLNTLKKDDGIWIYSKENKTINLNIFTN